MKKIIFSVLFLAFSYTLGCAQVIDNKLKNRLSYTIHNEALDESFIHFYLLIGSGAIHETPTQAGMAHFIEHLALGNTSPFVDDKTALDFLNSIGVVFGKEINATTHFDHTIYKIKLPIFQKKYIPQVLQIFRNILSIPRIKKQDLIQQRDIITQEYHSRNVDKRKIHLDLRTHNTQYWNRRIVIGHLNDFQNFTTSQIQKFYNEHYTSSNAKIIVLGEVHTLSLEKHIKNILSNVKYKPKKTLNYATKKKFYFTTEKNKENNQLNIYFPIHSKFSKRKKTAFLIYSNIIKERLDQSDLTHDAKFRTSHYIADLHHFNITINNFEPEKLYIVKYLLSHKISKQEFDYQMEKIKKKKKSKYSNIQNHLTQYIDEFLYPPIKDDLQDNPITLKDVQYFSNFIDDTESLCIGLQYTTAHISKNDFLKILQQHKTYKTTLFTKPKKQQKEQETEIKELKLPHHFTLQESIKEKYDADSMIYHIELKNGAKVYLHNTNNPKDSIIDILISSKGGTHTLSDKDYKQFESIWYYLKLTGISNLNKDELLDWNFKYDMSYLPYIDIYDRGMMGKVPQKSISKMLQQIYGYFTSIKKDEDAFKQEISEILSDFTPEEDTKLQPLIQYKHKKIEVLQGVSYRENCRTKQDYLNLDYNKMYQFYKDYLIDPKHFNFIFSGNFNPISLKDTVIKYIGNIPAQKQNKNLTKLKFNILQVKKDTTVIIKKYPNKGTFIEHSIQKRFTPTPKNEYALKIIGEILKKQFRKEYRENKRWVYNIETIMDIMALPYPYFRLSISHLISSKNSNKSITLAKKIIRQFNFTHRELTDAKAQIRASQLKRNYNINEKIKNMILKNLDFYSCEKTLKLIEKIDTRYIQNIYQKYLSDASFITFQFEK